MFMVVAIVTFTSCGDKSTDPQPVVAGKTNLEIVKASLVGSWTFKSVKVTELSSGKSATTSTCSQSELIGAKFSNENWKDITPEPGKPLDLCSGRKCQRELPRLTKLPGLSTGNGDFHGFGKKLPEKSLVTDRRKTYGDDASIRTVAQRLNELLKLRTAIGEVAEPIVTGAAGG